MLRRPVGFRYGWFSLVFLWCWIPLNGDECLDVLGLDIDDVDKEDVVVDRSVRESKALLKVLTTVGEDEGPVVSERDKAVVDLPKVIGREAVCKESFGRLFSFPPALLLSLFPLTLLAAEHAVGRVDSMLCCDVEVFVSCAGTMFESVVRPQESEWEE